MQIFGAILFIAGMIMLARSVLFWLYWIQTKDNRLDRIWLEIKSRNFWKLFFSFHRIIVSSISLASLFAIIYFVNLPYSWEMPYGGDEREGLLNTAIVLSIVLAIYLPAYAIVTTTILLEKRLKLPKFTPKVIILFLAVSVIELIALLYINGRSAFNAAVTYLFFVIETFQPLIVIGMFTLAYTPNIFLHRYFIKRAKAKITSHKNLIVIGITGSYGKTSTKEYLAHILGKKFKVLKTPAHINVDTGVAKVILRNLKPEHEIFIVEMGAYKRGEIKKICDLVRPQYAVMTGLSDQHLELFGSMEAIADAKFELVEAVLSAPHPVPLPRGEGMPVDTLSLPAQAGPRERVGMRGAIIANEDSAALVSEFKRRAIMPTWYGLHGHASRFKVSDVKFNKDGTVFTLHGVQFSVPTIGTAALNNLLGAITVAVELGMHLDGLPAMLGDLPVLSGTMRPQAGPNGALLIDDTYNANTEGVITALTDLEHFRRARKIFVFSEVIELGARTEADHLKIAQAAAQFATYVFLLPSCMLHAVRTQLIERGYEAAQIIRSTDELKKLLDVDTVVLFEGRDAAKILAQITKQ